MADLLPCPFCGGAAVFSEDSERPWLAWTVFCTACDGSTGHQVDMTSAIDDWQRRATPAVQEEGDAKDGARYREFFASGLPITFLGVEYRTKAELDAAIDALKGDQP